MIITFTNIPQQTPNIDDVLESIIKEVGHNKFNSLYFPELKSEGFRDDIVVYTDKLDLQENQVVCTDVNCVKELKQAVNPVNIETRIKQFNSTKFIVNITTEDNLKKAVIHYDDEKIDFDEKRGDREFKTLSEAQEYANSINNPTK